MWVYLEPWLVQDGSLPELQRGQLLRNTGLVAHAWSIERSEGPDGVSDEQGSDSDGRSMRHCKVTGTVEWSRTYPQVGDRMVLRADDFRIFVEPAFIIENPPVLAQRCGPWWRRRRTIWEPVAHRRALAFPAPGSRVAIHCSLGVCEDYVLEELGDDAPDVRADWIVDQIQMELRERVWHGEPGREWAESGHAVRVEDINQMQWDDEGEDLNGVYHLDLRLDARYTG